MVHIGANVKTIITPLHIDDPAGLLHWAAPDRCMATFTDEDDIAAKRDVLVRMVQQWLEQM